jgi:hypothetical protein
MISTVDDVARFYRALLDGRLLPPAQQRELLAAIPVNDTSRGELFAEHYGLGIYSVQLSCGTAWGHDGGINGTLQSATGTPSLPETGMVCVAPPAGFEPAHPPPEGGALSPELWGLALLARKAAACRAEDTLPVSSISGHGTGSVRTGAAERIPSRG